MTLTAVTTPVVSSMKSKLKDGLGSIRRRIFYSSDEGEEHEETNGQAQNSQKSVPCITIDDEHDISQKKSTTPPSKHKGQTSMESLNRSNCASAPSSSSSESDNENDRDNESLDGNQTSGDEETDSGSLMEVDMPDKVGDKNSHMGSSHSDVERSLTSAQSSTSDSEDEDSSSDDANLAGINRATLILLLTVSVVDIHLQIE